MSECEKLTILIIDDESDLLSSLERPLKTKYHVLTMTQSTEVMNFLKTTVVDCILLDIRMPGLSGLELLKEIKFTYSHIPTLIMTGHGDNEDTILALKYGASGYIKKPLDIYLLFDEIKRVTTKKVDEINTPAKILFIDRDPELEGNIRQNLQKEGHHIFFVNNTDDALQELEKQTFDIVVFEIEIPNMNGFEFLEKIKKIQINLIPILLTQYQSQQLVIEAIKHGVFDFIKKPLAMNELSSSIRRSLHKMELNRAILQKNRQLTVKEKLLENLNNEIITQRNYLASIVTSINNIIITTDKQGKIKTLNNTAINTLGYAPDELIEKNITTIIPIENFDNFFFQVENNSGVSNFEEIFIKKNGDKIYVIYSCTVIKDKANSTDGLVFVAQDISSRKEIEESLYQLSYFDPLTKLPNRLNFEMRAKQLLSEDPLPKEQVAFLCFDLDGFKSINDRYGHAVGDELLKEMAKRLQAIFRDEDFYARLSGYEFVACVTRIKDNAYVGLIAQRVITEINRPFFIENNEINVGICIGIALFPESATDYSELLKNADVALYKAKQSGKNQFQYYTSQIQHDFCEKLELKRDLSSALNENEFKLTYQPIYDLTDKSVASVEAQIQWNNKRIGLILSDDFIPLAESTGLITSIGEWIIEESIKQYALWKDKQDINFKLSINISALQFDKGNYFIDFLKNVCLIHKVLPPSIQLEFTETAIMHNPKHAQVILKELNRLGFIIIIDNFGRGISSLSLLSRLPIHIIKMDLTLIENFKDKSNSFIIKSTIAFSKVLDLIVIAEGIKTAEQLEYLVNLGCNYGQGQLLAKPEYPEELKLN